MKYKSNQESKYLLFFVFHSLFLYCRRFFSIDSPIQIIFKIGNALVLFFLIIVIIYEIWARKKFDKDSGEEVKLITKSELVCLFYILAAILIFIIDPFRV